MTPEKLAEGKRLWTCGDKTSWVDWVMDHFADLLAAEERAQEWHDKWQLASVEADTNGMHLLDAERERDEARGVLRDLAGQGMLDITIRLTRERDAALILLRRCQFGGDANRCNECWHTREQGHSDECPTGKLLDGKTEQEL